MPAEVSLGRLKASIKNGKWTGEDKIFVADLQKHTTDILKRISPADGDPDYAVAKKLFDGTSAKLKYIEPENPLPAGTIY